MTCILEMCLWKLKSLSKITPRWRTLSDGDISLSSNLTGKWLESVCLCCFVPIIINSDLLEFSYSHDLRVPVVAYRGSIFVCHRVTYLAY